MNKKIVILAIFAMVATYFVGIPNASAASLTSVKDVVSTMKASTAANHTITFVTPTGITSAGSQTAVINFGAGFDLATNSVTTTDVEVSATSGTLVVTSVIGQAITLTCTVNVNAGATVTVKVGTNAAGGVNQIINGAAGNSKTISIGGTMADSGILATAWLTDDVVNVTATVNPTLEFSISDNTVGFGTLTTSQVTWANGAATGSAVATPAHTMSIGTNAVGGYSITYNGATLTSGANTISAATVAGDVDGTPGTEQFGVAFTAAGGSGSITAAYDDSSNNWDFVPSTVTQFASHNGSTATRTISAYYKANIAANTEYGAYATNITYTATGTF